MDDKDKTKEELVKELADARRCVSELEASGAEHEKAQEAPLAGENKYRTLLENLPQKVFLKDKDSVYVSCNENYARDLKIKADDIVGKTDYEFFPKELAEKYRADDKKIMESGGTEDIEERYIQHGKEVFVHTVKTPVKNQEGNVVGILGIFWDISEQKRAEEELKARNEELERMNRLMIGRELRMVELKKEIKELKEKLMRRDEKE